MTGMIPELDALHLEQPSLTQGERNSKKLTLTNAGIALGILIQVVGLAMEWQHVHDVETQHEERIVKLEASNQDMILNGHPDHERRIARLESIRPDATAALVATQSTQIDKILEVVQTDHDSIVKLTTAFEYSRR